MGRSPNATSQRGAAKPGVRIPRTSCADGGSRPSSAPAPSSAGGGWSRRWDEPGRIIITGREGLGFRRRQHRTRGPGSGRSGRGLNKPSTAARRSMQGRTSDALRNDPRTTSVRRRRVGVLASDALPPFRDAGFGAGGGGGSSPVEPGASNRPPAALGTMPARTLTECDTASVDLASCFSAPYGDTPTYGATTSGAGVASISVSEATPTIAGAAAGTATVTVTASDPGGPRQARHSTVAATRRHGLLGPDSAGTRPSSEPGQRGVARRNPAGRLRSVRVRPALRPQTAGCQRQPPGWCAPAVPHQCAAGAPPPERHLPLLRRRPAIPGVAQRKPRPTRWSHPWVTGERGSAAGWALS